MTAKKKVGWHPKGEMNPAYKGGVVADKEWFKRKYEEEGLTLREIAKASNRSLRTVARYAHIHGIKLRPSGVRLNLRGDNNPNWKGGTLCGCGQPKSYNTKTCASCYYVSLAGEGNPNYKGRVDIAQLVRQYCHDYWRPLIFERDNYTCLRCGDAHGGNLCAHHIERFEVVVKRLLAASPFQLDTAEGRQAAAVLICGSDEINDLDNGVTLCEDCHRIVHRGARKDHVRILLEGGK